MPLYVPLYLPEGGKPLAFKCGASPCAAVTRTRRGMLLHLWRKHKIKAQLEMDLDKMTEEELSWLDK